MKRQKKSLIVIALFAMSVLMLPNSNLGTITALAESKIPTESNLIQPMSVEASAYSFVRVSNTNAKVTVKGYPSGVTPFIKLKITLQSAPLNSSTYSNVSGVNPDEYTVYDAGYIYRTCSFPVTTTKNYRVKIEITDKVNGLQTTKTYYCKLT